MEKMNGKLVTFTGIIVLVLLVAIFGFLFWEPKPEYIQERLRQRKYVFPEKCRGGSKYSVLMKENR